MHIVQVEGYRLQAMAVCIFQGQEVMHRLCGCAAAVVALWYAAPAAAVSHCRVSRAAAVISGCSSNDMQTQEFALALASALAKVLFFLSP